MNEKIINERWEEVRKELKSFQKRYYKLNRRTQDTIQEIFSSYDVSKDNLHKKISRNDKDRLLRKIEKWKDEGITTGYFAYLIEELLKRVISYKDLIKILLIGTFSEEKSMLSNDIDNLFKLITDNCYSQGRADLGYKPRKHYPKPIDELLQLLIIDGVIWKDFYDALVLTNAQELEKQYIIAVQQNKPINVYDDSFQRTFEKQRNRLISTSNNKYSGGLDKYTTALGNIAYIEASGNKNQKVKFISDMCDNVTEMCSYMNGMIFNTRDRNVFKRPYGDTQKDLTIQNMDIMGLILGINQPPITKHFHWCHSTLTYITDDNIQIGLSANNNNNTSENHPEPKLIGTINPNKVKDINNVLKSLESQIKDDKIENAIVITKDGEIYQCFGNEHNVWPDIDLGDKLYNSYITHNHPKNETLFSFSQADIELFEKYQLIKLRGVDYKYTYEFSKLGKSKLSIPDDYLFNDYGLDHLKSIQYAIENDISYMRWNNE